MPTGYVLGDMATKAAYFSVARCCPVFISKLFSRVGCCIFR